MKISKVIKYDPLKIESKWQKKYQEYNFNKGIYFFEDNNIQKKIYVLDMFPYPSGAGLHVGHPKGYTATDVFSRFKKKQGYNVLHPIGWDAFGLPAEQYAIETKNSPKEFTQKNINNFKNQINKLGFSFPENKIINTTNPNYYKWTQWIFLKLYKQGLAEFKDVEVNWCQALKTVLSNEEIILTSNNMMISERGGHLVIKKPMKQWVLKITKYADKLLEGLDQLDWPESIKEAQRNWIGKINGALINLKLNFDDKTISAFIVNPGLLKFASLVAFPSNYFNISEITDIKYINAVKQYINECQRKDNSKLSNINNKISGIFTGCYLVNPINGNKLPIWITNSLKFYGNRPRIISSYVFKEEQAFAEYAKVGGENFDPNFDLNLSNEIGLKEIINKKIGNSQIEYNLHDWIFSRQRYWGEPFPVYFDDENNIYLLDEKNLPLLLPEIDNYDLINSGSKVPLENISSWMNFEIDGKTYHHDINIMPQWAGSSWYYIAYLLIQDDGSYLDLDSVKARDIIKKWLPVDLYIGGQEHAVLHLLYARFWHLFLYDIGIVSSKEPFQKLYNQGMILGENGEKMSKSKGNVINPDDIVKTLGADTLRLYEMFMGPLNSTLKWSNDNLSSMHKWLERVFNLLVNNDKYVSYDEDNPQLAAALSKLIYNVENNIEELKYNICISEMMIFINKCYLEKYIGIEQANNFLIVLSCFCPYIADEIYANLNKKENDTFLYLSIWPKYDKKYLKKDTCNMICQVNGKLRATIEIAINLSEEEVIKIVNENENIKKYLQNQNIKNTIFIKNKIINFVLN